MNIIITLILFFSSGFAQAGSLGLNRHYEASNPPRPKRLVAATSSSKISARGAEAAVTSFARKARFDYIADETEETVFATTLDVESQWPVLVLEDFDDGLESVSCTGSQIQLAFASGISEEEFSAAAKSMSEFVVVTAHDGCDLDGGRSAHIVTGVNWVGDAEEHLITLDAARVDWHNAFSSTKVSFQRRDPTELRRRESALYKRQQSPTSPIPPVPTAADGLNSSASADFDMRYNDRTIYPIDNPIADQVIPQLPMTVRCKTCTLQGDVQLSRGEFDVKDTVLFDQIDEAVSFFRNGSVEFLVRELFSQVELEFELDLEDPLLELTLELPSIPLTPFQIAGVVTFGPYIVPEIILGLDVEGDIGFSYGFNATVPDHSRILINMTNIEDSAMAGFPDTKFNALPFEASTEVTSMKLSVAFRPNIVLAIGAGIDAIDVNIEGEIGAFVSLPTLSLNVSRVNGVNENCESAAATEDEVVGNATHLLPSVELDVGVKASYDVNITDLFDGHAREVEKVLASTSWDLPTACVLFEPEVRPSATGALVTVEGGGDGDGGEDTNGGDGTNGSARLESRSIASLCGAVLAIVAAGF
ncbi:hypothetical protein BJX61DRAFT_549966 [Aspergillus egyptiacus]|nr:hypothetical protein BJX61DRAFT_549966 [Aspergillus egyptiacus]